MTVEDPTIPGPDHDPMPEGEEPPPRGARTMAAVRWAIVLGAAVLAAFMWLSYARTHLSTAQPRTAPAATKYHCPMHPQIVSGEPGECPICHMTLEPIAAARGAAVKVAPPVADAGVTMPGSVPPGTTAVKLALDRVQAIGVRTAVAQERSLAGNLRVTAIVMPSEQGQSEVHVRAPGFVEAMYVDQTGVAVQAGQALLGVYSPELLQAQSELLATSQWSGEAGASSTSSARRKLELLGMGPAEIERVVVKREPIRAITVTAPRGGFVTKKSVVLGSYVTPEMVLYEVQDLSRVYVIAEVFLADVASISTGAEGRFVPSEHPERAANGKVDLVYPLVSPEARTRRVRMQIRSEAGRTFAPGEYGTLELAKGGPASSRGGERGARQGIAIPRDALIETGTARYVFVVEEEGQFVPRVVAVSGSDGDDVIVAAGLAAGERVVSGATFLIDSESRLQASIAQATQTP